MVKDRKDIETYPNTNLIVGSLIGNGLTIAFVFSFIYMFFFKLAEKKEDPIMNLTGVPIAALVMITATLYIIYENKINNIYRKLFKRG